MKPLYYAIMKYMTKVDKASNLDVINALKNEYGNFKMLRPEAVEEALMTAKANGILDEAGVELEEENKLIIFYKVTDYGREMIDRFISD